MLGRGDIGDRVSGHGHQVGELARLERADRLRQPEQLGIDGSRGLECGDGVIPCFTISWNSRAFSPCFETPESVPNPTLTPSLTASPNVFESDAFAATALAAISGGSLARFGMIESGAINVGIKYVPRSFISFKRVCREKRPVLDRVDAGEHRVAGGLVAVAVAGDLLAQPVGLVAKCGHLGQA